MSRLYHLTTERLLVAVGIDVKHPRFGWKIASDVPDVKQEYFRVKLSDEQSVVLDTGEVKMQSTSIRCPGHPLKPMMNYRWELTVGLSNGEVLTESAEFMTGVMDTGLLDAAEWIALDPLADKTACPAFRREFKVKEKPVSAKLYTVGCGVYEVYLNGAAVQHKGFYHPELKPGYTEVLRRKFYHSYDVTDVLGEQNCLSAIVTTGWWSDQIVGKVGRNCCFKALLVLDYADGKREYLGTDDNFRASYEHPVRFADIYTGEEYDARYSMAFTEVGFDDANWVYAKISHAFDGTVESMHGEPVVCRTDLTRAVKRVVVYCGSVDVCEGAYGKINRIAEYESGAFVLRKGQTAVIDFGQNAAGREHFKVSGKAGTVIEIRHGEICNDRNGEISRGNDGPGGSVYTANMRSAKARTLYTIGKDDVVEEYRPVFSFYGFQYLSITATEDVEFYEISGEVLTNVSYDSGKLVTGNAQINRLIENGRWGMYSNYVSLPTDCPQRDERLGWTADTQVFVTAAHYYSTAAQTFLEKWGQDLRDAQEPNGAYTAVAPRAQYGNNTGAIGWADAGILMPYYLWRMTGDVTLLEEHYHSMKRYMDDFLGRRGNLGPEECFGDWLSFEPNSPELQRYLCVCFYAFDAMLMAKMADTLGKEDDAAYYVKVYEKQKAYYIEQYVNADGTIKLSQQTAALYALHLNLLPDAEPEMCLDVAPGIDTVQVVKQQLLDNIRRNGMRLQTGFLGTAILLPTLSQIGANDVAYELLLQDAMPSWLYSVKAGATTFWERWNSYSIEDGFGDVGMNSFNHYAYGVVADWMFGYMAGIRPAEVGFNRFILAPIPDKRMGFVEAEYDSVCGRIRSCWRYEGDGIWYECEVPANTEATLIDPFTGDAHKLTSGKHRYLFTKM